MCLAITGLADLSRTQARHPNAQPHGWFLLIIEKAPQRSGAKGAPCIGACQREQTPPIQYHSRLHSAQETRRKSPAGAGLIGANISQP